MEQIFTGGLEDPRPLLKQEKNWSHEELFGMGPYIWKEIPEANWPSYTIRNQNGSGKCGPFSLAFALGRNEEIENGNFVLLDTDYIYSLRANDGPGMWMDDLLKIGCLAGSFPDPKLLSDNNNDQQSAVRAQTFTQEQKESGLRYRGKSWLYINPKNIDGVAQVIAMGYTPIYLLRCNVKEWTSEPFIDPNVTPADYNINHFVPAYIATMWKDKPSTVINDSWGSSYGRNGRRILNKDFMDARVQAVGYVIDLASKDVDKPHYTFSTALTYGMSGPEVKEWQKILQYEKILPTHTMKGAVLPMGYFGPMTAQATREWQIKHGIMDFAKVEDIKKIRVGPKSIALANNLY